MVLVTNTLDINHHIKYTANMNYYYSLEEAQTAGIAPWQNDQIEREDFHIVVYRDLYPVTPGHLLFVPRYVSDRLVKDCFSDAYDWGIRKVQTGEWQSFNIGMNNGQAAGQTVGYPHIHLIPRTEGDTEDPTGGVRNVIPGAGNYRKGASK
jgi:diadenosine tetraphosphate (Ap4A) HIT family hydrolase